MATARRETESLNGWWHTWFDEAAPWRDESPPWPGTPPDELPPHEPTVGWGGIEEGMESLAIPGTWAQSCPGYRGVGWHWRPLVIPDGWSDRRIYLCFGGVRQAAEVYLDDALVGYHVDGATPFAVDLTPHVQPGRRYELAVRVVQPGGAGHADPLRPIPWGDRLLPPACDLGGIWGDVTLEARPVAHLVDCRATPGEELASVSVSGAVVMARDERPNGRDVTLTVRVTDGGGRVAAEATESIGAGGNARHAFALRLPLDVPRRWSPQAPHRYTVAITLAGNGLEDVVELPLGLRRFVIAGDGFYLNGQRLVLRALQADRLCDEGRVLADPRQARRRVEAARNLGFNLLLAADYPLPPATLQAADELGLLVCQGMGLAPPPTGDTPAARYYRALAEARIRALVRRDRRHPSVVWWNILAGEDQQARPEHGWIEAALAEDASRLLTGALGAEGGAARQQHHAVPEMPRLARACPDPGALPDLPALLRRFGDRLLPGSDAARWQDWLDALQGQWTASGLAGVGDPALLWAGSQRVQSERIAQELLAWRVNPAADGLVAAHWLDAQIHGLAGVLDPRGEPHQGAEAIARANAERALVLSCSSGPIRAGETIRCAVRLAGERPRQRDLVLHYGLYRAGRDEVVVGGAQPVRRQQEGRHLLGEIALTPPGEGLYTLAVDLTGERTFARASHTLRVVALGERPGQGWRRHDPLGRWSAAESAVSEDSVLIASWRDEEALLEQLATARAGARVAWLADDPAALSDAFWDALADLAGLGALGAMPLAPSRWHWLFSGQHALLEGVAAAGVWSPTEAPLCPRALVHVRRGHVDVQGIVGGCAIVETGDGLMPRLGLALGVLPLGQGQLLFSTMPARERLLANVVRWLVGQ